METTIESQLASELQEMYLENKEWLSNLLFLEDEMRFFKQLHEKLPSSQQECREQVESIGSSLTSLQERRDHLKTILDNRQNVLEAMIKDEIKTITLAFIEEDTAIINEIKALLATDRVVKKELFALIEALQPKSKRQKYPIL